MKPRLGRAIAIGAAIAAVLLLSIFGALCFAKLGPFRPGKLLLDGVSDDTARAFLTTTLNDLELHSDLTITQHEQTSMPEQGVLYRVLIPTTNFYTNTLSVEQTDPLAITWIPAETLDFQNRLLTYEGNYYLDNFSAGAKFQYFILDGQTADCEAATAILERISPALPNSAATLTLAQTGVTALSRGMTTKLTQVGDATYFSAKIRDFLRQFDLTHTSNEASFSSLANASNICSRPEMIDVLTDIGLDIVELTGNHNQDCGDDAALATLQQYQALNIRTVGGGATATAAAEPLTISAKTSQITMLAYNYSTGGYTLDDTPGANFYVEEDAATQIAIAKARGDFVIVDVQFFECNNYDIATEDTTCDYANSSAGDQIGFFRHLIDLGADVVVGTAAHQPQTYELYGDGAIYYGLGNLFFDQAWWPGTTRSLILVHYFWENQLLQTRLVPTVYDRNFQTQLLDDTNTTWFLDRLTSVRPRGN